MINKFKELMGKVVSNKEVETQTTIFKKAGTYEVECAIDEEVVGCDEMDNPPFVGVPAPAYLEDDPWFGAAPVSNEKQMDYMVQEAEIKMAEEQQRSEQTCESHDIHAKMYEIATQNWTTVAETQGGSENFQEGPGGWNSGTGANQFNVDNLRSVV